MPLTPADRPDPTRLANIEAMRGVAAMLVVLFHAGSYVAESRHYGGTVLGGLYVAGRAGVDVFFVLSGFILAWVYDRGASPPQAGAARPSLARYAWRRATRILPAYWIITLLLVGAFLA